MAWTTEEKPRNTNFLVFQNGDYIKTQADDFLITHKSYEDWNGSNKAEAGSWTNLPKTE